MSAPTLVLALALALGTSMSAPAWAAGKGDHDRARAAVRNGEVLPLPAVLERLQRTHPGQVLELELEHDDGRWIYEVKLLQADGRLLKLKIDAGTAQVLKLKQEGDGKGGGKAREKPREKAGDKPRGPARDERGERDERDDDDRATRGQAR